MTFTLVRSEGPRFNYVKPASRLFFLKNGLAEHHLSLPPIVRRGSAMYSHRWMNGVVCLGDQGWRESSCPCPGRMHETSTVFLSVSQAYSEYFSLWTCSFLCPKSSFPRSQRTWRFLSLQWVLGYHLSLTFIVKVVHYCCCSCSLMSISSEHL